MKIIEFPENYSAGKLLVSERFRHKNRAVAKSKIEIAFDKYWICTKGSEILITLGSKP